MLTFSFRDDDEVREVKLALDTRKLEAEKLIRIERNPEYWQKHLDRTNELIKRFEKRFPVA